MMNFVEIKVFVFDVFGMIVDWRSGVVCGVVVFLDCYVLMFVLFVFVDVWCVEYLLLMEEICSGCCCYVWFDVLYCENFVCMFDCFGIDDVFDVDIDVFNFVWYWFDLWFDVVVGLYWLKQCYIIVLLLNGNIWLMVDVVKYGGLLWDVIFGVEVVCVYKLLLVVYIEVVEIFGFVLVELCLVVVYNGDFVVVCGFGLLIVFVLWLIEYGFGQMIDL